MPCTKQRHPNFAEIAHLCIDCEHWRNHTIQASPEVLMRIHKATGCGTLRCKRALASTLGNEQEAIELLDMHNQAVYMTCPDFNFKVQQ